MSNKKPLMSRDPLADLDAAGPAAPPSAGAPRPQARGIACVGLPPTLTISEVGELHPVLLAALQAAAPVELDGGAVESVDGAGLQLLAGFVKSAEEISLPVSWRGASERLRNAADTVGLGDFLRLGPAAPAA